MFITKKHLSRRTVLQGRRRGHRAAAARCDDPGRHGAGADGRGKPTPRLGFVYFPHGAVMTHWTPAAAGTRLQDAADPGAARKHREPHDDRHGPAQQARPRAREPHAHHRAAPGCRASSPQGREPPARRRRRDRPTSSRRGTSARTRRCRRSSCNDRALRGGAALLRWLARRRSRCRWRTTRATCSTGCSARATRRRARPSIRARPAASSTACSGEAARLQAEARRAGPATRRRLSRLRARDRAPRAEDASTKITRRSTFPSAPLGVPDDFDAHFAADVRSDGARVPGGPDARRDVHDGEGSQHAHVQHSSSISEAFHPLSHHAERSGKLETAGPRFRPITRRCSRASSSGWPATAGRRRLAARSLDPPVRQQHEQQRPAQQRSAAARRSSATATAASRAASTCAIRRTRRTRTCC